MARQFLNATETYIAAYDIAWPEGRPRGAMCCGPEVPVIKAGTLVRYEPCSGHFFVVDPTISAGD